MRKKSHHWRLTLLLLLIASFVQAQQTKPSPRIGYLGLAAGPAEAERGFEQSLRALGWMVGQNVVIEYRWAANDLKKLPVLADELARMKVDVLVASATPVIEAIKKSAISIPVVMVAVADPIASGFIKSLAQPGGNITGLSLQSTELSGKWLELLKEVVPRLTHVAFLAYGGDPAHKLFLNEVHSIAPRLGMKIEPIVIEHPGDVTAAFASINKGQARALVIQPILAGALLGQGANVARLAATNRLPTISDSIRFPEAGGLMSYGANRLDLFQRAASFVDKILKGRQPADLPVEQPMKFELVINLKTAKQIGLTIPQWTLMKADRVIK